MNYRKTVKNVVDVYKQFYKDIKGGIDGYYEKVIFDSTIYEVYTNTIVAYFTVNKDRGLTSLVVLPDYNSIYSDIFKFVISLPLFSKILFTENDIRFYKSMIKNKIDYEIQAYNFTADKPMQSMLKMKESKPEDYHRITETFGEFIKYNHIKIEQVKSFYFLQGNEMISFGALEPLRLNKNRYCISMIVNERYRQQGYGTEIVKYLISYLQKNNLECNARCYVLNEPSKRTLLKSGLKISNKLFKAEL